MKTTIAILLVAVSASAQAHFNPFQTYTVDVPFGIQYAVTVDLAGQPYTENAAAIGVNGNGLSLLTVCADMGGTLNVPQSGLFEVVPLANAGGGLAPLWSSRAGLYRAEDIVAAQTVWAGNNPERWAALQVAVWQVLYDTSPGGQPEGMFTVTGGDAGVLADAAALVVWEYSQPVSPGEGSVLIPQDVTSQELLVVPEPKTLTLVLLFAVVIFWVLIRKR